MRSLSAFATPAASASAAQRVIIFYIYESPGEPRQCLISETEFDEVAGGFYARSLTPSGEAAENCSAPARIEPRFAPRAPLLPAAITRPWSMTTMSVGFLFPPVAMAMRDDERGSGPRIRCSSASHVVLAFRVEGAVRLARTHRASASKARAIDRRCAVRRIAARRARR